MEKLLNSDLHTSNNDDSLSNFERKLENILSGKKSTFSSTRRVLDGSVSIHSNINHRQNYMNTLENLLSPHVPK